MKVLLVSKGFPPRVGGVETLCRQLADGLSCRGDEVTVVTYGGRLRAPEMEDSRGYRVLRLPSSGSTFEHSGQLTSVLRSAEFDVCHVHNLHSAVATDVWRSGCRPYVLTGHYHGGGHSPAAHLVHPVYRRLAKRIVHRAAAVTAVSPSEARLIHRHFGVEPEIIPNGIEVPCQYRPDQPRAPHKVVVVSRLVRYKRVDAVIRAMRCLPEFRLQIIGDGPEKQNLVALSDRQGVRQRVDFVTHRLEDSAVSSALASAGVYVNLSEAESFSYTVLESLAASTPVVVNGGSNLRDWVSRFPEQVGAAEPDASDDVADKIRAMAGSRARADLQEYSLGSVLDRYQQIYRRVVE